MSFPQESTAYPEASQASTALVLGIVGLVCCQILGIVAWIMANNELEAIKEGRRNPQNEGTATAARIIGIIATVLLGLGIIALIVGIIAGVALIPLSDEFWREDMVPLTRAWRDRLVLAAPLRCSGSSPRSGPKATVSRSAPSLYSPGWHARAVA